MPVPIKFFVHSAPSLLLAAAVLTGSGTVSFAQDSGINLALHANSHAGAADIGLPVYPGATLYNDDNESAADLGLTVGDFHFSLLAVNYVTSDPAAKVLAFYRKPLSHYGEVLECNQGNPVGARTVTHSGLTCGHASGDTNNSTEHEIRAGSPLHYRIVGIDDAHPGFTHFGLVYLELPKDSSEKTK
jgi:hypothetical protein